MNNKGYTLFEMLACIVILGIVLYFGISITKGTFSSSYEEIDKIRDNEIFNASIAYAYEKNVNWINNSVCISIKELVDYGYIDNNENNDNKYVRIIRNDSYSIINTFYDNNCNN